MAKFEGRRSPKTQMQFTMHIKLSDYETLGGHSLSGMFVNQCREQNINMATVTDLVIECDQTSHKYRDEHNKGEPTLLVMPEFTPMCLMDNILHLAKQFDSVTVRHRIVDNPT